jgi:oligoribonuclease NrnB/cAMP/cGMP phosphodiesterase (DHH superfamily)
MAKCHHIYSHNDLDGAVSVLVYMWSKPKEDTFQYTPISNMDIDRLKNDIKNTHNPSETIILDLGLREEFLPDLDLPHITFVDHHKSSEEYVNRFKKAKIIYKEYSSNALLTYKFFKETINATDAQKTLVAIADDFDSYKLQIKDSYDLNIIFWTEYQNRFSDFIKDYYDGFKPFNQNQKRSVNFIKNEAAVQANKTPVFFGEVTISGKKKKVCAAMVEKIVPYMMDVLISKHSPDLFFFINIKNEKVSIRQCSKDDPIDCGALAKKVCEGGGHANAAGGKLTPLFMEMTKNLKPL